MSPKHILSFSKKRSLIKMKTLMSILAIVAIAVLCGTGAFVTQGANTPKDLVVLADTALSQRIGGKETNMPSSGSSGKNASCSVNDCPENTYTYTPALYSCVSCYTKGDSAYTWLAQNNRPRKIRSWCDDYWRRNRNDKYEYRCDFKSAPKGPPLSSCEKSDGTCP